MASLKFVFRPSSKAGKHPGRLCLRVIQARKPKTVTLSYCLFPEEWDATSQSVYAPSDNSERADYLSHVQQELCTCADRVKGIIHSLEKTGSYSVNDIMTRFHRSVDNGQLLSYAEMLSEELQESKRYRTAKAYLTVCRGLIAFNKGADLSLSGITASLIKRFETHLKELGKQPNTISYYMRNLRAIYNKAVASKRIPQSTEKPFAGVFTGIEETRKRALNVDEVIRLKNIDFDKLLEQHQSASRRYKDTRNLQYAWYLFFFCLYAQGMSFVDLCHLKKSNIIGNEIRYYRKKTGGQVRVPINEGMQQIIRHFADEVKDSPYLFPVIGVESAKERNKYETAMRTQNRRLKKLAQLAGVEKCVSTHVSRHSWATICKHEMLPLSVISEGLGHSSEKMTRKYLDTFDHSILGRAGKAILTATSRPLLR